MRFGVCVPPAQTAAYIDAGIDYVEWPMSRTVGEMDDDAFDELVALADALPVTPEAWNVMLPPTLKISGPDADPDGFMGYIERAFARAARLGGEVVAFGSGGARNAPDGWGHQAAIRQFASACRTAGDAAQRHDITVAIEPLNRAETNLVNGVAEAVAIATDAGLPRVRVLSDLYHVAAEGEPLADTAAAGALLVHAHIAEPGSRHVPKPGAHEATYEAFLAALRDAGYGGRLSLECREMTPESAAATIAMLRGLDARVAGA
jgi:D-psicose/D-tagatose/L-ribulose 3-epimerase